MLKLFDVCIECGGPMYQQGDRVKCAGCGQTALVSDWQCPKGCGCFTDGETCENCQEIGHCNGPNEVTE